MKSNAKIIVKQGGKLIVDGGIITTEDSKLWSGIEVWGNKNAHQYQDTNGHYAQGYVELKNGAVIENAVCAVELWRPGHYSTTGGIVHAEGATFRNCAKAVHALHYTNRSPVNGTELPYAGTFRDCAFVIDSGFIGSHTFHKHVDLNHVNGIGFSGCDFAVDRHLEGVSPWCVGIGAYTSGFSATAFCDHGGGNAPEPCPDAMMKGCTFIGFHQGIHADNDGSAARTFNVRHAAFVNNTCGIHALNTGFATIVQSDFAVGCGSECDYGIYADGVTGFCIEENSFRPMSQGAGTTYGIVVRDSQGANDIYRNSFDGLCYGNVAVGSNTVPETHGGIRPRNAGLTYTCNENSGNAIDFCVTGGTGSASGIRPQQGSPTRPAGNTFSGSHYHFYNGGDSQLTYYHDLTAPGQTPDTDRLHRVTPLASTSTNGCPSHYGGGSVVKSGAEKTALEAAYLTARAAHDGLGQLYGNRLDGGSTAAETAVINTAAPSDLWQLRAKLLGDSPYLSREALTAAAERDDVFPASTLFEILAANPDELKKDSLIRYLENKRNPMPTYMTELLRMIAAGTTARTALEAQMGKAERDFSLAAGDIVRSNLNDTLADHAELRAWLGNMESLAADRMAVASFVQHGDFDGALALAATLPELYGLQETELNEHNDYMSLLALHKTLAETGRTTGELKEDEVALVENLAENGTGTSKAMAESLLRGLSEVRDASFACPTMPPVGRNHIGKAYGSDYTSKSLALTVSVGPNPATTWTAVNYELPQEAARAMLTLYNMLGMTVMTAELNGSRGQEVLNLEAIPSGTYVLRVALDDGTVFTDKVVKE